MSEFAFDIVLGSYEEELSDIIKIKNIVGSIKVLLIDGNKKSEEIIKNYLRVTGIDTIIYEGNNNILKNEVDLVIIDDKQKELLKLGEWKLHKNLKVILLSYFVKEEIKSIENELKIDKFIPKPVIQSNLYKVILEVFQKKSNNQSNIENDEEIKLDDIRGARILVVEDNEINQQVVKENLENEGFWVDTANNGIIAIEKLDEMRYDLLLMDLQMPVLDGYETTEKIRKDPRFYSLPINCIKC